MHGGEKGEYLYYVHQGEARLMRTTLDGREKILMSMRSGTVTGETPFFDEVPARSSIVAGTDCVVYAFSRDCVLHEILPNYPAMKLALLHSLASKVRVLCNQSVSLSLEAVSSTHLDVYKRQERFLPGWAPLHILLAGFWASWVASRLGDRDAAPRTRLFLSLIHI